MSGYLESVLVLLCINTVLAYAAFLPMVAGQLNLGVAAFVAIGAYSGGYLPAVWSVYAGGANERVRGMILLDALYAETDKLAAWLAAKPPAFFVSAYTRAAREENEALQKMLVERQVKFQASLPPRLAEGSVTFVATGDDIVHDDFVTKAWTADPVKTLLARVPGFSRTAQVKPAPAKAR